jgi:hypothetical protein
MVKAYSLGSIPVVIKRKEAQLYFYVFEVGSDMVFPLKSSTI